MKTILLSMITLLLTITFSGCDNFDLLWSEKKLNNHIQKTWKIVYADPKNDNDPAKLVTWTFQGGTVSVKYQKNNKDTMVVGTYGIDARFSKAFVNLNNFSFERYINDTWFTFTADDLNRQWSIVQLDNNVMYLTSTDSRGAIRSLEFVAK